MKHTAQLLTGLFLLPLLSCPLRAQPVSPGAAAAVSAGTQPTGSMPAGGMPAATAPATQPRYEMTIPPGFKLITINERNILLEEADEPWVSTALAKVAASTRPATQPALLVSRLAEHRSELLTQLARDLALTDLTAAASVYDTELTPAVQRLEDYRPPIFYLVTAPTRLNEIMRDGWAAQHFYYNRAADSVSFNPTGAFNLDRQDDVVFPAVYNPEEPPDKRAENLTVAIGSTEASIAAAVDIRARQIVGSAFIQLAAAQLVGAGGPGGPGGPGSPEPLELKDDQIWFQIGVASWLGAKYAALITGEKREDLNNVLTFEHPANPLKTTVIDLLNPTDPQSMRPEALPAYFDAVRRKSTRAIRTLVEKAGEEALPKSIVSIRAQKPADGEALAKLIQQATGIDLTPHLVRGS